MNILEYYYRDVEEPGWDFEKLEFGRLNLFVGDTATGKTRLLNTIFNLGRLVAAREFHSGHWEIKFEASGVVYSWHLETRRSKDRRSGLVVEDQLSRQQDDSVEPIVERDEETFSFQGNRLPKLTPSEVSITLLREEDAIRPIHRGFASIQRRRFFHDALLKVSIAQPLPSTLIEAIENQKDLEKLFRAGLGLSANLFLLKEFFPLTYKQVVEQYRSIFPFVQETRIRELSQVKPNIATTANVPLFQIRERGSQTWIALTELSSGMQKVLLILTDLVILPESGVYIIDEYENSLGINAINFFPEFLLDLEKEVQFFITSHHPYIINEIPPSHWYVFHREGMQVLIRHGQELAERFDRSKHEAFIQLINDPFFTHGVQ